MSNYTKSHSQPQGAEEFHAKVPRSQPVETTGHQIGRKINEADHAKSFAAETHNPGTAPKDKTFEPNPQPGVLPRNEGFASANDNPGVTSQYVHQGLGMPVGGQSSVEERHPHAGDGKRNKRSMNGQAQYGKDPNTFIETERWTGKNVLDKGAPQPNLSAQDRPSESA